MSNTLDDFFGDGSADNIPECSFCGDTEGELIVSVQDAYGPTHWHHAACKTQDDAKGTTPLIPTWDEAMTEREVIIEIPFRPCPRCASQRETAYNIVIDGKTITVSENYHLCDKHQEDWEGYNYQCMC